MGFYPLGYASYLGKNKFLIVFHKQHKHSIEFIEIENIFTIRFLMYILNFLEFEYLVKYKSDYSIN